MADQMIIESSNISGGFFGFLSPSISSAHTSSPTPPNPLLSSKPLRNATPPSPTLSSTPPPIPPHYNHPYIQG
ncbi:hypothetical protein Scep_005185 [Stephania cephalantha]|uniref:Uncharacterized protein n=1 Tax=Stephania cephalantha TaxID=152367 RepID=A0AAP0KU17_9MAGN